MIRNPASRAESTHPSRSPAGTARSARQNQDDREIDYSVPLDYREPIYRPEAQNRRYTGDQRSPKPSGRITLDIRVMIARVFDPIRGDDHPYITRSGSIRLHEKVAQQLMLRRKRAD